MNFTAPFDVAPQQVEIGIDVMVSRNGVEDEIEAASVFLHLVSIARDDHFIRTEAECVFLFI
ncbi:hypothetical protein [Nostoc sp. 'Peltigera membranacea cyanobiont' 213]|uniref:hypothetical protein n=1 Tax=Nostoc sp. 'Peltigera membranacea cyanobiont' 213 TaxID=2014530 RepID=UPI002950020B|nr:hypothetical protein [Nostoc sp. 'Peltigera membranacea cyanobiont' 213]